MSRITSTAQVLLPKEKTYLGIASKPNRGSVPLLFLTMTTARNRTETLVEFSSRPLVHTHILSVCSSFKTDQVDQSSEVEVK